MDIKREDQKMTIRRIRGSIFAVLIAAMLFFSVSLPAMAYEGEHLTNDAPEVTAVSESELEIEDQEVPLANAAPMATENTSSMKVMPAFVVLLGISLTLILRKKEDEEDLI